MKTVNPRILFFIRCYPSSPTFIYSSSRFIHSNINEELQRKGAENFSSSSSSLRHRGEESRNVKVSVWWDIHNCSIAPGVNVFKVTQWITSALRLNGIKGPISITAFGDVFQIPRPNHEALVSTGVNFTQVPHGYGQGGKNGADRFLLVDLLYWVSQNPPPAHILLISGDKDFANILHRLRMNNYNILLASTECTPGVLCSAASIMWHWPELVKGENLTGKHFDHPSDGVYGSLYGHYKGPLDDPFLGMEHPACSQVKESLDSGIDTKSRPIPKVLVNRIRQILKSNPKGLSMSELRLELTKSNIAMDKDFFGYKRFSRFLLSMPDVLELRRSGEGQPLVYSIHPKATEAVESILKSSKGVIDGDKDFTVTTKVDEKLLSTPEPMVQGPSVAPKEIAADTTVGHSIPMHEHDTIIEEGFFQRIWRTWFGHRNSSCEKSNSVLPKRSTEIGSSGKVVDADNGSCNYSGKLESNKKFVQSSNHHSSPLDSNPSTLGVSKSVVGEKTAMHSEKNDDKSSPSSGLFTRMVKWCVFWKTRKNTPDHGSVIGNGKINSQSTHAHGECSGEVNMMNCQSETHELFSKAYFWDDMESYLRNPKGSAFICQSKTREQMVEGLQKRGPLILTALRSSHLFWLVDMLISEKKWVVKTAGQTFPFKVTLPARSSSPSSSHRSNGLSSIFFPRSHSRRLPEHDIEKEDQNPGSVGYSRNDIYTSEKSNKKPSKKSKLVVLADCEKLLTERLKETPEGLNIGSLKPLFFERYGYNLDYQDLGYQKLVSLLETIPGVKVESAYILPTEKSLMDYNWKKLESEEQDVISSLDNNSEEVNRSDDKVADSACKYDDTVWNELGPVSETCQTQNGIEPGLNGKHDKRMQRVGFYEKPCLDEVISDSDEEYPTVDESRQGKHVRGEEENSLIQILDSWYGLKGRRVNNQSEK